MRSGEDRRRSSTGGDRLEGWNSGALNPKGRPMSRASRGDGASRGDEKGLTRRRISQGLLHGEMKGRFDTEIERSHFSTSGGALHIACSFTYIYGSILSRGEKSPGWSPGSLRGGPWLDHSTKRRLALRRLSLGYQSLSLDCAISIEYEIGNLCECGGPGLEVWLHTRAFTC